MTPRSVCVFTSIRSEYGLLRPVLRRLQGDARFELRLVVGGAHFRPEFGATFQEIQEDGFVPHRRMPFLGPPTTVGDRGRSAGRALARLQRQMSAYLAEEPPDLLLVLGDRFELLPVATAALVASVPLAHVSGGDTTEGALDNQVRHALTKLAHLHFPATEAYAANLRRMGEEDFRIFVSGEPGLDEVLTLQRIPKERLFADLGIPAGPPIACVTFHPETIDNEITPSFVEGVLEALVARGDLSIVATAANFDEGGAAINERLQALTRRHPGAVHYIPSLGKTRYYSLLPHVAFLLGNSSSGLVEAQSFGVPAVNVGKRQRGRLANPNVLDVDADAASVLVACEVARRPETRASFEGRPNLYGDGHAAPRIVEALAKAELPRLLAKKDVFS